jgi:hypothetical protein
VILRTEKQTCAEGGQINNALRCKSRNYNCIHLITSALYDLLCCWVKDFSIFHGVNVEPRRRVFSTKIIKTMGTSTMTRRPETMQDVHQNQDSNAWWIAKTTST